MSSIFDLKTSVEELSSTNEGTSRMEYDQHPPTRDVTSNNFANGAIHFRFQTSGQKWWIPSRSYIRTRIQLTRANGDPLVSADDIAPNMALMANLFQSAEMRINDKVVSRVSDFMPQVDALEQRLTKSKSWLDSVGDVTNFWNSSQSIRQQEVSSDGALIKNESPNIATETTVGDLAIGFAAANTVAYTATTGVVTFAAGAGAAPPNTDVAFRVGDFFVMTTTAAPGALNVRCRVIAVAANLTMTVSAEIPANIAASAGIRFSRVRVNPPAAAPFSKRVGYFETCWCPPLSLFKVGHALPSMRAELILNPQTATSYQKRGIESALGVGSKNPILPGGVGGDFKLNIVDMYLYCATVEGPRADDITYLLDLEQTRCQAEKIDNPGLQQKNFDVSPSSYALSCAFQDLRCGEVTSLSASKFKTYNAAADRAQELNLNRFFINYAGQNLPAPDADPSFLPQDLSVAPGGGGPGNGSGVDYTIQRYTESQIYSGAYFDTGGAETIEEYHDRGAYYYFSWPRKPSHCVCCY